eukprot:snap_masked-scaffold_5-processed-gene-4.11-mRNA-1 protein AED:1.00 eAED:1.00 QI:0/-1/0/0/-1/1/1/0/291
MIVDIITGAFLGSGIYLLFWFVQPLFSVKILEKLYIVKHSTTQDLALHEANQKRVNLTVVVSTLNQESGLTQTISTVLDFLSERKKKGFSFEVVVVDRGSTDRSLSVAKVLARQQNTTDGEIMKILQIEPSMERGGSIMAAINESRGEFVLVLDSSSKTPVSQLVKLEECFESDKSLGLATISPKRPKKTDSFISNRIFGYLNEKLVGRAQIRLFRRKAALQLMRSQRICSEGFELETTMICNLLDLPHVTVTLEYPVENKATLYHWLRLFECMRDWCCMQFAYRNGFWKV